MGAEKEFNKVLSEIYSDLENLRSAREQVEGVTGSSMELSTAIAKLLEELKEFSSQFEKEHSSVFSQLNKRLKDFENKLKVISEKGSEAVEDSISSFKEQNSIVIDQISIQIKKIVTLNETLKVSAEKSILEIKEIAIKNIETHEQIILKTIASIENTNSMNKEFISKITEFDLPTRIEDIDKKIEIQINQGKLLKKMFVFSLIGLGAVFVFFLLINIF